jgi:hypothetical protein
VFSRLRNAKPRRSMRPKPKSKAPAFVNHFSN